jgi:hypothetical protein
VPGRPLAIWVLAAVAAIAGLVSLVILLQFLDVIPATGDTVEFWGGKWAGVVLYGVETIFFFALVFGWLFLKPWAPIFTLLFALFGFFVPLMSYFAGTSLFSVALGPMILSVVLILLSTRPQVRLSLAEAAAYRNTPKPAAPKPAKAKKGAPAPAAVARPNGFRSDEV